MTNVSLNPLRAGALSAALLTAASPAMSDNPGFSNGVNFSGWDRPDQAEFVMTGITTSFTTGEPDVVRDIHIDCDLLVEDGDARHYTTGFAMQFNAETERTAEAIGPQNVARLQSWVGQLDYRASTVGGTITHLEGAHGISRFTVRDARERCMSEHPDHGIDINQLGTNFGLYHPAYER